MKKLLTVLVVALCLTASLFAQAAGEKADEDNSLQKVLDKGQFILGLDDSFPPMGYRDENNEIVGYDIDLAKEVASRLGVEFVAQPIDWNAKEQELNTGNIDCIWNGFTVTPEREKQMSFSAPYLNNAQVVVVKGDSPVTSLSDLKNSVVGVQAGSSAQNAIEGTPEFANNIKQLVEFKENLTALMDLEIGGVQAVAMDLFVAADNINRSGKDFKILDETLADEVYAVGFRKNDIALRDKVDEILLEMAADGTIAKISTEWFGADISTIGK